MNNLIDRAYNQKIINATQKRYMSKLLIDSSIDESGNLVSSVSQNDMCNYLDVGRTTVINAQQRMQDIGFITTLVKKGQFKKNIYLINIEKIKKMVGDND